ncbi:hypothetical protein ACFPYI_14810 [Halomarina salina]|uniref:Uncharacterized protein n=1 Tax=Halomarina salina TaxID=1872699 RepID=A0ABD5RQ09_9EURY|nr:hypothetical protein [Halomarina salina]
MDESHLPITTEAALVDQFAAIIESAHHHGVDVEGAWTCRDTETPMDYELLVSAVTPA